MDLPERNNDCESFTAGKDSRKVNGSIHTTDTADGETVKGQCSILDQKDEDCKFVKELSENSSENRAFELSDGIGIVNQGNQMRHKSETWKSRKNHSEQNKELPRHTVQYPSRSGTRYDFLGHESSSQKHFNHQNETNEVFEGGKKSFSHKKWTKGQDDTENFSDCRKTGHSKLATNRAQKNCEKYVLKKESEAQNVSKLASSRHKYKENVRSYNFNGNKRQQRKDYEEESRISTFKHKENWQDRNAEHTKFEDENFDGRPESEIGSASEERQGHFVSSELLKLYEDEESDDEDTRGARDTMAVLPIKDSVSNKSFNQHPKYQNSGKRRDLPQPSKWQDETQRGLLIEQLSAGKYECLVCCNVIRREAAVWSCVNCHHVYHMFCIKKWAQSSAVTTSTDVTGNGWRCPTCQNLYLKVPNQYICFCGKMKDPEFNRYATPHSCNEICGKVRGQGCPHLCNILCHPGPCPPCSAFVMRSCDCGKAKRSVRCAGDATCFKCNEQCLRTLNCGLHECRSLCHSGPCEPCGVVIEQKCYCGHEVRAVRCGSTESCMKMFSCNRICSRQLSCGEHTCDAICHSGPCHECPRTPSKVTHCPCGRTLLKEIPNSRPRKTCRDPISMCNRTCEKELECGNEDAKHLCKQPCHLGPCTEPCDGTTEVTCRCGAVTKELPCEEFLKITESSPFICDKRCKKKTSCGRHKCGQLCCVSTEHQCQLICGYKLRCGLHRCEERCHQGNCPSCWQVSFDELRCHCGAEVSYPPVPCGAKPPKCDRPCTRQHPCSHQTAHHCHSESTCPPCTILTRKWCMGRHELRSNIPCHIAEISCGMPCGKELPCVVHKCLQSCHKGPCLEGKVCIQPCQKIRKKCGHTCAAPCHQGSPCPATACQAEVTLLCECGRRKEKGPCLCDSGTESQNDYSKMTAQYVAAKLWEGQSIDLSVLAKEVGVNRKIRMLQCDTECAIMERNKRLAHALEISNSDHSSNLGNPLYSQFLKDFARQNPAFVANVEKDLSTLVTSAQQAKVTRKSHAFKVMLLTQRRVIHELAEFYGCLTESFDEEPNRNVVASAVNGKCWLPTVTLTTLVQGEPFPKASVPMPINCKEEQTRSAGQDKKHNLESGTTKIYGGNSMKQNETQIDYFDITD